MSFRGNNNQLSSKPFYQPSPTTPSCPEYIYSKGYRSLEEVRGWSELQIADWLCQLNLGRFIARFKGKENNIKLHLQY
jgi:mitogen-activated protein kinase kinase kinase